MTKRKYYSCCGADRSEGHVSDCRANPYRGAPLSQPLPKGELWNVYSNNPDQEPEILGVDLAKEGADFSCEIPVMRRIPRATRKEAMSICSPLRLFGGASEDWPVNMCFHPVPPQGKELVGEFVYDRDLKRWTFSGNMDESAKIFAKFMFAHFQSLIDGNRDGL